MEETRWEVFPLPLFFSSDCTDASLIPKTAYISVKRIEDFLAEEDVPDWVCGLKSHQATVPAGHIEFRYEACFAWNASSSSTGFRLGPISLQLPVGRLTLVTGPTGAGKSTFLGAILGGKFDRPPDR